MIIAYTVYQSVFFIFIIIFFNFVIYALVPFMQPKLGDTIDQSRFKKKNFSKLIFLFKPIGGGSSKEFGIIFPLIYLHLFGYLLGITVTILIVILAIAGYPIINILRIITYILGFHAIASVIFVNIIGLISKKGIN